MASDRTKVASPPFTGGLEQFTDPSFLSLADFQEAFNVTCRNANVQKRTGYSHQFNVVSAINTVPFVQQFIARNGSRYMFCMANGTFYKLT